MAVPGADQAIVPVDKAVYLLDENHPQNRGKAAFFKAFGFRLESPAVLAQALLSTAHADVRDVQQQPDAVSYVVISAIQSPDGRNPTVRAVWWIDAGTTAPRLVTAHPHRRRT